MNKLIFIFTLLFLFSCNTQKEAAKHQNQKPKDVCKPLQLLTEDAKESDSFDLDSLAVHDDCLEVFVTYSGGCGGAVFELFYTNKMLHSMPPQTVLHLLFKDDDPCRSIVQDTLYFDLSVFKDLASSGGVWLRLKDSEKRVLYSF